MSLPWASVVKKMNSATLVVHTRGSDETQALGEVLGQIVAGGQVLALSGDLGAGKTTFVQGVAAGMGVRSRVTSPTFVLINEYAASQGRRLVHADTYRLADAAILLDAATFGLAELLDEASREDATVVAVEWAERVRPLWPEGTLQVEIAADPDAPDARTLRFMGESEQAVILLLRLAEALHAQQPHLAVELITSPAPRL